MRILILYLALSACNTICAQQSIVWGSQLITWNDFKGDTPENTPYKAITYSEVKQFLDFDKDTLTIEITAEFIPSKSWVLKQTDYLLQHERLHFDIVEYVVRLFRRDFLTLHFESYDDIKPKISALFKRCSEQRKSLQRQYDKETDHSKIRPKQEFWNNKVDSLLNATEAYTEPKYKMYIGYLKTPR